MHTYIHTYVNYTYIHTYIHTYMSDILTAYIHQRHFDNVALFV